jgi:hypothetical protein
MFHAHTTGTAVEKGLNFEGLFDTFCAVARPFVVHDPHDMLEGKLIWFVSEICSSMPLIPAQKQNNPLKIG